MFNPFWRSVFLTIIPCKLFNELRQQEHQDLHLFIHREVVKYVVLLQFYAKVPTQKVSLVSQLEQCPQPLVELVTLQLEFPLAVQEPHYFHFVVAQFVSPET